MPRKKILKKEHLEDFIPLTTGDRINYIVADSGLNGSKFCKSIRISTGNLNGLINDDSQPSAKFCALILDLYEVNINWLLTGEGDPYINKVQNGGKGTESDASIYEVGDPLDEDPEITELLSSAKKILKSGTDRAETLAVNIQSSYQWVIKDGETENRVMLALDEIKNRLADLEQVAHPPKKVCQTIREGDDHAQRGEILKKRKA